VFLGAVLIEKECMAWSLPWWLGGSSVKEGIKLFGPITSFSENFDSPKPVETPESKALIESQRKSKEDIIKGFLDSTKSGHFSTVFKTLSEYKDPASYLVIKNKKWLGNPEDLGLLFGKDPNALKKALEEEIWPEEFKQPMDQNSAEMVLFFRLLARAEDAFADPSIVEVTSKYSNQLNGVKDQLKKFSLKGESLSFQYPSDLLRIYEKALLSPKNFSWEDNLGAKETFIHLIDDLDHLLGCLTPEEKK